MHILKSIRTEPRGFALQIADDRRVRFYFHIMFCQIFLVAYTINRSYRSGIDVNNISPNIRLAIKHYLLITKPEPKVGNI